MSILTKNIKLKGGYLIIAILSVMILFVFFGIVGISEDRKNNAIPKKCEQAVLEAIDVLKPAIAKASVETEFTFDKLLKMETSRRLKINCNK